MSYIKDNFREFIQEHGHHIMLKHTDKKQSCPLPPAPKGSRDTQSHDSHTFYHSEDTSCIHCFGFNYLYNSYKVKIRRSDANSMYGERLDLSDEISHSGNTYDYFFLPHVNIGEKDFIIEYRENNFELFVVLNTDSHYGDKGILSFKTALVAEVIVNKDIIEKSLKDIIYK